MHYALGASACQKPNTVDFPNEILYLYTSNYLRLHRCVMNRTTGPMRILCVCVMLLSCNSLFGSRGKQVAIISATPPSSEKSAGNVLFRGISGFIVDYSDGTFYEDRTFSPEIIDKYKNEHAMGLAILTVNADNIGGSCQNVKALYQRLEKKIGYEGAGGTPPVYVLVIGDSAEELAVKLDRYEGISTSYIHTATNQKEVEKQLEGMLDMGMRAFELSGSDVVSKLASSLIRDPNPKSLE